MNKQSEHLSKKQIEELQTNFIAWYQKKRRNLPWRQSRDPYFIWISEIMLQQTRVETVIAYFYRFTEKYPTIEALAKSDEQELLKVWEGLGYYSRARNLKKAAQQIMTEFGGVFPNEIEAIRSLKGIGPYTAGAIASIAFQRAEPAIDGNAMRVISRLYGIDADIAKPASRNVFDAVLRQLIPVEAPGDFNQALMDLGSGVCTPKKPVCTNCPLKNFCFAYQTQQQDRFPVKTKAAKPKDVYYFSVAITNEIGEYLLVQRPDEGLLAKMWTFPLVEVNREVFEAAQKNFAKEETLNLFSVAEELTLPANLPQNVVWQKRHLGEIRHIFSHLKWHVLLFYGVAQPDFVKPLKGHFVPFNEFSNYVFPKPQQKLVELLEKSKR
ncbi:A/G-specific adenine glycosylase [Enterococcus saigonensis]|nr:A/G-specific adenine glycosylase [Enterococcus saigonensis]